MVTSVYILPSCPRGQHDTGNDNRPFRMQYDATQPNTLKLCGSLLTRTGRPTRRSSQCSFQSKSPQVNEVQYEITRVRKGASIGTPLVRRQSRHEGTASDSRGNHTAVTAAAPRSPRGRAVRRRGCTSLERRGTGPPLTRRPCTAPLLARTAGGPPTRSTRMSARPRTARVVSKSPPSWWSLLIGLSYSDVECCRRWHTFFYLYDSCCATASESRRRRRNTWEMERETTHMP